LADKGSSKQGKAHVSKVIERFEAKYIPEPNSGCWIWLGTMSNRSRAMVTVGRKKTTAARVAYQLFRGVFPQQLHVLHRCDNPLCVNPGHLWLGTHSDNMRDMHGKGRHPNNGPRRAA